MIGFSCRRNYANLPTNKYEYFGKHSRCFETVVDATTKKSGCYEAECQEENVLIKISDKELICSSDKVSFLVEENFLVKCPDPKEFCQRSQLNSCPNDCNGKG